MLAERLSAVPLADTSPLPAIDKSSDGSVRPASVADPEPDNATPSSTGMTISTRKSVLAEIGSTGRIRNWLPTSLVSMSGRRLSSAVTRTDCSVPMVMLRSIDPEDETLLNAPTSRCSVALIPEPATSEIPEKHPVGRTSMPNVPMIVTMRLTNPAFQNDLLRSKLPYRRVRLKPLAISDIFNHSA